MMKSMVSLGLCCILFSIITTTYGQPPFPTFPRFGPPPRIIRGFPGPPGFGRIGFRPPLGRPAFIGGDIFGPPLVGRPGIGGGPIFTQPGNAIFNGNPFVPPFSPVNVVNNGLPGNVGFPTNTVVQGNSVANTGIAPNFGIGTANTGNIGTAGNTIGNNVFGTPNTGPNTVITQGPPATGTGVPVNVNTGFPTNLNTAFPAPVNTGFPATLNTGFPAPLPNTGFPAPGLNSGFFASVNTAIPGTLPSTGAAVPGSTNVFGGTNTLTGAGVPSGTGTLTNQFLLNNGVPALAQVNSLGTQVTSNVQTDGTQDNMVLAAGNSFANRFTVTGEGASQTGTFGGETGGGTFQDPTSGQTISGNTLLNTGLDNAVPAVDTSGAGAGTGATSSGIQGTELPSEVAVIGTIGTTDAGTVDPNALPTTAVGSKCQATGCSADQQCVFAGEYPCAMYLESLECRCQAGCRVMNFFIPEGQSRQVDSCGNVCSCDQTGENKGTARCTTINCPQQ
ncbi:uncharacterized protein LOC132546882 [Ylistrum balloti]|uniref:uncharacterized protein LOC132546882 n=1 Tax=Ylistrum balloti TaxID=509963 RepID=UPI002905EB98|nr:uncharacterized protein LOC132546882 [Ylistrum balloti]